MMTSSGIYCFTKPVLLSSALLCLSLSFEAATPAQEQPVEASTASDFAVLDVAETLNGYKQFQEDLAALRKKVEESNQQVVVRQAEIASVTKQLQQLQPGSPDYESKQLLLVRLQTELNQLVNRSRQGFLVQEAGYYKEAYDRLKDLVRDFAKKKGIRLVLRVSSQETSVNDPKTVLNAVNEMVVFQDGVDITEEMIKRLNQQP